MTSWQNRIIGEGTEAPDQLLANPKNWRIHPKAQQDALSGVLDQVGWIQRVIVNQQSGHVIDGHLRVALAISHQEPTVPVLYVDLDENEEALALATLDPLSAMAITDKDALDALMAEVATDSEAIKAIFASRDETERWVGPEFSTVDDPIKLVLSFASEEDREQCFKLLSLSVKRPAPATVTMWWPLKLRSDAPTESRDYGLDLVQVSEIKSASLKAWVARVNAK